MPTQDKNEVPRPTRTDLRRERTRAQLVEAGRGLITEKGVAALRILEITERADVALGSFYNYFATKEELVEAVVGDSLGSLASAVVEDTPEHQDAGLVVSLAVRRVVRIAYEDPDFARLIVNLSHSGSLVAAAVEPYARRALERGIESHRFADVDIELTLTTVAGGALALMDAILDGRYADQADVTYAELVLRSLGIESSEAEQLARRPL